MGLSAEDVIASFDRYIGEDGSKATYLRAGSDEPLKSRSHFSPVGFGLTLAAGVLVGGLSYFGWNIYRSDSAPAPAVAEIGIQAEPADSSDSQPAVATETLSQDFVPAAEVDESEDPELADPESLAPVETLPVAQPESVKSQDSELTVTAGETLESEVTEVEPKPQAEELAEPLDGEVRLAVKFSEDCWIEVRDANGIVMVSDLKRAGSELDPERAGSCENSFG